MTTPSNIRYYHSYIDQSYVGQVVWCTPIDGSELTDENPSVITSVLTPYAKWSDACQAMVMEYPYTIRAATPAEIAARKSSDASYRTTP